MSQHEVESETETGTKIAVLSDAHGNLPALEAALAAIRREGCDAVYHTGDAIAIGPYPAETLDLLLNSTVPHIRLLMGNHDAWFAHGLPDSRPEWMSDGEFAHQHWVHAQIDPSLKTKVATWPYLIDDEFSGLRATFLHYALTASRTDFVAPIQSGLPADFDRAFHAATGDLVFYGHDHKPADVTGRARYLSPGSLGCHPDPVAKFLTLTISGGKYDLTRHAVPYDRDTLFRAFAHREVPERAFILRAFFGQS